MTSKVRYEVADRVATVTIDRPEVRNAMDREVFDALYEAGRRAGADPEVRAVVLAGEGGTFSSGLDTSLFVQDGGVEPIATDIARLQRAFTVYEEIPKPVVAALAGHALGGGFQLAIAADLRVAAEDVKMSVLEIRWGIIPDLGATIRLPRLIGAGRAKELAMFARTIGADEALAWGLVNKVVPPGEHLKAAAEWARELAGAPPLAVAGIKRLVNAASETAIGTGLEREAMVQRRILASSDFAEAVRARLEKRNPEFTGG